MKKIICLALTMLLFLQYAAFAEDFALRNGIVFGDTLDVVKQKETLTIQSSSEDKTDKVWFEGTIAGMDGSVRFDFDEETGKLTDMLYDFDTKSEKTLWIMIIALYKRASNENMGNPLETQVVLYILSQVLHLRMQLQ